MADPNTEVVSGSTETPLESSTDGTQTEAEQTTEQPREQVNWRQRQKEDAELNAHIQSEISRARTRWQRQQLREHAKAATETNDANYLRYVAQQAAAEQDEPDEGEALDANWVQAADRIQPQLERMLQLDATGRATNPYYVLLHQKVGRAEMDRRYAEDPIEFVNWVDDQIMEMRVDEKVKKVAPSLAGAMAQDEAHARLRNMPTPLGGSAGNAGMASLEQLANMSAADRIKFRNEHRRDYDEIIARAAR